MAQSFVIVRVHSRYSALLLELCRRSKEEENWTMDLPGLTSEKDCFKKKIKCEVFHAHCL